MSDPEIYVRDLLWAINSPQLMRFENESPTDLPSVSRADIDGQHLRNWLLKRPEKRSGALALREINCVLGFSVAAM